MFYSLFNLLKLCLLNVSLLFTSRIYHLRAICLLLKLSHMFFIHPLQSANISKPVFAPLDGPNSWIDINHHGKGGEGSPFPNDWVSVDLCDKFLRDPASTAPGAPPFFLYCSVLNPHPPYDSNATWEASVNLTELSLSLDRARRTYVDPAHQHPADRFTSIAEGVPVEWNQTTAHNMALAYHGQVSARLPDMCHIAQLGRRSLLSDCHAVFTPGLCLSRLFDGNMALMCGDCTIWVACHLMVECISPSQVAEVDAMLGRVLAALEASGAASRTYVVFTSDHGEMHLEHRFVEKMSM